MSGASRVLLFTGDGKGKTTAALGMAVRAAGHGMKVLIVQFLKTAGDTGELEALRLVPGVAIRQMGCGFVSPREDPCFGEHHAAAEGALRFASDALASGKYDQVILDEICVAVAKGVLSEEKVIAALGKARGNACVVMTGRDATPDLIALADTVTEMRCRKHALREGRTAEKGVEF